MLLRSWILAFVFVGVVFVRIPVARALILAPYSSPPRWTADFLLPTYPYYTVPDTFSFSNLVASGLLVYDDSFLTTYRGGRTNIIAAEGLGLESSLRAVRLLDSRNVANLDGREFAYGQVLHFRANDDRVESSLSARDLVDSRSGSIDLTFPFSRSTANRSALFAYGRVYSTTVSVGQEFDHNLITDWNAEAPLEPRSQSGFVRTSAYSVFNIRDAAGGFSAGSGAGLEPLLDPARFPTWVALSIGTTGGDIENGEVDIAPNEAVEVFLGAQVNGYDFSVQEDGPTFQSFALDDADAEIYVFNTADQQFDFAGELLQGQAFDFEGLGVSRFRVQELTGFTGDAIRSRVSFSLGESMTPGTANLRMIPTNLDGFSLADAEWTPVPPPATPGDTDIDQDVDLDDLNAVRNHFGEGEVLGPPAPGEAYPFDGVVDLGDLNLVRNHFGAQPVGVSEPSAVGILLLGAACIVYGRCSVKKSQNPRPAGTVAEFARLGRCS